MMEQVLLAGRYRLEDQIAAGGMGRVYRARDERVARTIAVKILNEQLALDADSVERFRREARSAAALSHQNIAQVFDYGQDATFSYIVMELAPGRDLARVLVDDGPLAPRRAARIGSQIAAALAHAHAAGIVHRDVKPGNVIVGADDHVKVTDFGIALAADAMTLTATGKVMGTARYLSPEQALGKKVGPPSDIYSLGVVLYEMVTGTVPFTDDSPVTVATRHVSEPIPRARTVVPDVPRALDDVVARATAKRPERRFSSAADMAAALNDCALPANEVGAELTGGTKELTPAMATATGPSRRNRLIVGVVGAAIAGVVLVIGVTSLTAEDPSREAVTGGAPATTGASGERSPAYRFSKDVIGLHGPDVAEVLEDNGFVVTVEEKDSQRPEGAVVGTKPGFRTPVYPGDRVTLYVSTGDEP